MRCALLLLLMGCASETLTEAGRRTVVVQDAAQVTSCKDLGAVRGEGTDQSSGLGDIKSPKPGRPDPEALAMVELQNEAGKRGATHVTVIERTPSTFSDNTRDDRTGHRMRVDGRAYRCAWSTSGRVDNPDE